MVVIVVVGALSAPLVVNVGNAVFKYFVCVYQVRVRVRVTVLIPLRQKPIAEVTSKFKHHLLSFSARGGLRCLCGAAPMVFATE